MGELPSSAWRSGDGACSAARRVGGQCWRSTSPWRRCGPRPTSVTWPRTCPRTAPSGGATRRAGPPRPATPAGTSPRGGAHRGAGKPSRRPRVLRRRRPGREPGRRRRAPGPVRPGGRQLPNDPDQYADAVRRMGAEPDAPPEADADDLAERYAVVARKALGEQGVPDSIATDLCARVAANLRYLAMCRAAGLGGLATRPGGALPRPRAAPAGSTAAPRCAWTCRRSDCSPSPPPRTPRCHGHDRPRAQPSLSRKEEALWLFQRLAPGVAVDNQPLAIRTTAPLDPAALESAAAEILRRHPALRTRFPQRDGVPHRRGRRPRRGGAGRGAAGVRGEARHRPHRAGPAPVRPHGGAAAAGVRHRTGRGRQRPVPGVAPHRLRRRLGRRGHARPRHHLPPDRPRPAARPAGGRLAQEPPSDADSLRYWLDRLDRRRPGAPAAAVGPPGARPPHVRRRPVRTRPRPGTPRRACGPGCASPDNMVLLAVYAPCWPGTAPAPTSSSASRCNLRRQGTRDAVGYHVNTLPVRLTVDLRRGFTDLAAQVRDRMVEALDHAAVSFEHLLGELPGVSGSWRSPAVPAHVQLPAPGPGRRRRRAARRRLGRPSTPAPAGTTCSSWCCAGPAGSTLQAVYSTEVHDEATVSALADRFELLLAAAAADPRRPLAELPLWTDAERRPSRGPTRRRRAGTRPTVAARIARRHAADPAGPALIDADGTVHTRRSLAGRAAAVRARLAARRGRPRGRRRRHPAPRRRPRRRRARRVVTGRRLPAGGPEPAAGPARRPARAGRRDRPPARRAGRCPWRTPPSSTPGCCRRHAGRPGVRHLHLRLDRAAQGRRDPAPGPGRPVDHFAADSRSPNPTGCCG